MTNEQILEKQVEALEKLLTLREAVIEELESKVQRLQSPQQITIGNGTPFVPAVWQVPNNPNPCVNGLPHQYPTIWNGTMHPSCTVCGHMPSYAAGSPWTTISGSTLQINPNAPVHTTGYIQHVHTVPVDGVGATSGSNVLTLANNRNK